MANLPQVILNAVIDGLTNRYLSPPEIVTILRGPQGPQSRQGPAAQWNGVIQVVDTSLENRGVLPGPSL
jgi:hypothetical protein